ncbi:gamma-butyrobetaine hydroxylase-like domain-containing protein [Methylobacterium sp. E-066]|uniref:gamma-butyrobetaine hydroxylase-like domain-containing protein n=1 Tax=Methylobacterium sp. E-066 TaxID=2836584 RepID=UPI001FB88A29|nr:DUF971 domain-containing protein [Methylobacterium sp. E-066]MCJ2144434.1 DUF971 domain-containing protein [Methylobacterium sp. E-066]
MTDATMPLPSEPPIDPDAVPTEIVLTAGGRALRLAWADGSAATLGAEPLRLGCRCAWCTRDRIQGRFPAGFEAVALTKVEAMGGYALHLGFSDGHARGIYPYLYLRELARETAGDAAVAQPSRAA